MTADIHNILKHVWPEWKAIDPPIGKGAFGTVYKAVRNDMAGESYSAIKMTVIPRDSSELEELRAEGLTPDQTSTYLQRIVQDYSTEIKMMMSVKGYTNIVTIDDYKIIKAENEAIWCILIRMELLTPLTKHIFANPMNEEAIVRLGIDLCTALDVCSSQNIIHRDIKPENIFVNEHGFFKLGDFGVARNLERITTGLSKKGTPNYMAPEVYKATVKDTDFKAACKVDIYSLGMVLYWVSNGLRLPFLQTGKQLSSPEERRVAFVKRMDGEALPPPLNVSPALQKIILKACAYRAEDRYSSAKEMREALYRYMYRIEKTEPAPDETNSIKVTPSEETNKADNARKANKANIADNTNIADNANIAEKANTEDNANKADKTSITDKAAKAPEKKTVPSVVKDHKPKTKAEDFDEYIERTDKRRKRALPPVKALLIPLSALLAAALIVLAVVLWPSGDKSPSAIPASQLSAQANTPLVSSVPGDINGDQIVDLGDLVRLEKYLEGWNVSVCQDRLDITGEGRINSADAAFLKKYLVGDLVTIH